ncbi:hypothetical protein RCL1_008840 [Eukaryota sp. TZLM3-RCL]
MFAHRRRSSSCSSNSSIDTTSSFSSQESPNDSLSSQDNQVSRKPLSILDAVCGLPSITLSSSAELPVHSFYCRKFLVGTLETTTPSKFDVYTDRFEYYFSHKNVGKVKMIMFFEHFYDISIKKEKISFHLSRELEHFPKQNPLLVVHFPPEKRLVFINIFK